LVQEEFGALKPTLPAGQVPVLQINGEYFPQSKAIEQYVARKAGLYPIDTEQAFIVDIVREVRSQT
jgi:prostaglandin-H2 D-isomerase / glutathione transferase